LNLNQLPITLLLTKNSVKIRVKSGGRNGCFLPVNQLSSLQLYFRLKEPLIIMVTSNMCDPSFVDNCKKKSILILEKLTSIFLIF
jgi:hypothetical protein